MTERPTDATVESSPRTDEPACRSSPPVSADSERHSPADVEAAGVPQKTMRWTNPIRVGDCTMDGMSITLEADGNAGFVASIWSSDDDDAWVIRGGISLLGSNGDVLFTTGKLVSPTCPESPAATFWDVFFTFGPNLYSAITGARINNAHC